MDIFIVGLIVFAAIFFTARSFIRIYNGEKSCDCGGCGKECPSNLKNDCHQDFPITK